MRVIHHASAPAPPPIRGNGDQVIYCDEAGFTGDHLLDPDNEYFVYAGACLEPSRAEKIVKRAIQEYGLQVTELKGSKLMKYPRGRRAVDFVISECSADVRLIWSLKKYALAGKFYEYTFGEILADSSTAFYSINFHKFISNLIYLGLVVKDPATIGLFEDFQGLMRRRSETVPPLQSMFDEAPTNNPGLNAIFEFCFLHKERILEILNPLCHGTSGGRWNLDLSGTNLFGVLAYWSNALGPVEVVCDESKPLQTLGDLYDTMLHRKEQIYVETPEGETLPVFFNLERPIRFERSVDHAGLQIADVFASALCYALNNRGDQFCENIIRKCWPSVLPLSVFPDAEYVDLGTRNAMVHSCILLELIDRTKKGMPLTADLPELFYRLYSTIPPTIEHLGLKKSS